MKDLPGKWKNLQKITYWVKFTSLLLMKNLICIKLVKLNPIFSNTIFIFILNQYKAKDPGSLWLNKVSSKNDTFTRLHEDPLLMIKKTEKNV